MMLGVVEVLFGLILDEDDKIIYNLYMKMKV